MSVAHLARFDAARSAAAKCGGFVTTDELAGLGVPRSTVARWCQDGLLVRVERGVYCTTGTGFGFDQTVHAATKLMSDQQAIGGRSALALWGLAGGSRGKIVVVGPKNQRSASQLIANYQFRDLRPIDITASDGIPVTTPIRSIIDASRFCTLETIGRQLTEGVETGLFGYDEIGQRVAELSRPGKRGLIKLRRILSTRVRLDDDERALNGYELRAKRLFRSVGFDPPKSQFEVGCSGRTYFVDFAWPARNLLVECDSMLAHSSPEQLQHDLGRQNDLISLGWTVVRFTYSDIATNPEYVAEVLSRHL